MRNKGRSIQSAGRERVVRRHFFAPGKWQSSLAWVAAVVFITAFPFACGGPQDPEGAGGECFRDADCKEGFVCIDYACSNDIAGLVSTVEGPGSGNGGMGGSLTTGANSTTGASGNGGNTSGSGGSTNTSAGGSGAGGSGAGGSGGTATMTVSTISGAGGSTTATSGISGAAGGG